MVKPKRPRQGKSAAIRTALGQLGWHANARDVVALLADHGIDVNEGLVHKVKLESLKDSSRVIRQQASQTQGQQRRKSRAVRKVPTQRTYRR